MAERIFRLSSGQQVRVPNDWSDDQIEQVLSEMEAETVKQLPQMDLMASHGGQSDPQRTWGDTAIDVAKGAGKGLLRTGASLAGMMTGAPVSEFYEPVTRTENAPQAVGSMGMDMLTAAVPLSRVATAAKVLGGVGKGAPLIRGLVNMAGGAGVSAAQGYEPEAGAVAALLPQAAESGGRIAKSIGRVLVNGSDDVAEAALRNRALPGLIRTGDARAAARIESASEKAADVLAGPKGNAPVRMSVAGKNMGKAFEPMSQRADSQYYEQGRQAASRIRATTSRPQPAREFFKASEGSRRGVLGKRDPASAVERGASADMRDRVAKAVPDVEPHMRIISDVAPVQEAYQQAPKVAIDPSGAPTLRSRLVLGTVNRVLGPTAQGIYNASRLGQSDMARLALLSMLEQSMRER